MLTGQGDLNVAMNAVNEGNIFRFLTKPCPPEELGKAIFAGMEQHNLIIAERILLERTLRGAVKVLCDVLSMVNPTAFGRASRVRRLIRQLCQKMEMPLSWKLELAAMLSQIGCVCVPETILEKVFQGKSLLTEEIRMFKSHPLVGRDLIGKIPRLEEVSKIIAYQEKHFDGKGIPNDNKKGSEIPFGSRLLKTSLDYDILVTSGTSTLDAYSELESRPGVYDPDILKALREVLDMELSYTLQRLSIEEMNTNMILAEDVKGVSGTLLIAMVRK
jgi:response regulator RpfG family c-di-GMP phosphodiesterase